MDNPISYIDGNSAIETFCHMVQILSPSGMEKDMACWLFSELTDDLEKYGVIPEMISFDHAGASFNGNQGNMFVFVPGTITSDYILGLQAHLDTVQSLDEIKKGRQVKPIRLADRVTSDGTTILSADDKAGIAVILAALRAIKMSKLRHGPLQLIFTVSEETRLRGARYINRDMIHASEIVSFDGFRPWDVLVGACGSNKLDITLKGISAHAGVEPEKGASALLAASRAIELMAESKLWGKCRVMDSDVTANVVLAGNYTLGANSVQPEIKVIADIRSFNQIALSEATQKIKEIFSFSSTHTCNIRSESVKVERFEVDNAYHAWEIPKDSGIADRLAKVIKAIGHYPDFLTEMGGVDASWFNKHGIPSTVTGMGLYNPHRTDEYLLLDEFYKACGVAVQIAVSE